MTIYYILWGFAVFINSCFAFSKEISTDAFAIGLQLEIIMLIMIIYIHYDQKKK